MQTKTQRSRIPKSHSTPRPPSTNTSLHNRIMPLEKIPFGTGGYQFILDAPQKNELQQLNEWAEQPGAKHTIEWRTPENRSWVESEPEGYWQWIVTPIGAFPSRLNAFTIESHIVQWTENFTLSMILMVNPNRWRKSWPPVP
jgi:hypothetical protein